MWSRCARRQVNTLNSVGSVDGGAFLPASDYVLVQQRRREMIAAVDDAFRNADVTPPRISSSWTPFNITGHPAVSLMARLSRSGLPLSMQLVGPAFGETLVLEVAAAYERCTEWGSLRPSAIST